MLLGLLKRPELRAALPPGSNLHRVVNHHIAVGLDQILLNTGACDRPVPDLLLTCYEL